MGDTSWKSLNIKIQRTIENENFQPDFEQSTKLFTLVVKNKKSFRSSPNNYPVLSLTPKVISGIAAPLRRKCVYSQNLLNPLLVQHTRTTHVLVALDLSCSCVLHMASKSHWFKSYEVLKLVVFFYVKNRQSHVFPL